VQEAAEAAADVVEDAAEAVGDAAEATVDFIEEHKAEIAGIVAGIAVTAGCLVITGGAGSIGCAALGGAVGAGLTGYMNGQRGWELVGTVALGAAAGALGGAAGALVGRGIGVLASRLGSQGFGNLSHAAQYGLRPYADLRGALKGTGLQAHHLIEQRFAATVGQAAPKMLAVAVTRPEHQVFTNAWRNAIPYGAGTKGCNPSAGYGFCQGDL
jgi:hypothetical protein